MNAFAKWFQAKEAQRAQDSVKGIPTDDGTVVVRDLLAGERVAVSLSTSWGRYLGDCPIVVGSDGVLRVEDIPRPK